MAPSLTFLKAARSASKQSLTKAEYIKITKTLNAAKDIHIPHFKSAMADVEFKHVNGGIHINDMPFSSVQKHLRAGKLRKFFDAIGLKHTLTEADEIAFKQINSHLPEIKYTELLEEIDRLKQQHPDLDIVAKEGMDLEKSLTPKAKSTLLKFWSGLKKIPKTKFVGLIGFIVIGKSMYDSVLEATLNRNGCYLMQHINGKTISCKVISKSCSSPNSNINKQACTNAQGDHTNIALLLLYALKTDNILKTVLEKKLESSISEASIPVLLSNVESRTVLVQYLKENDIKILNPCSYENFNKIDCVACNTSADVSSIEYVDSSDLPENMSYACEKNSTILGTIADIAYAYSMNLIDGVTSLVSGLFKYLAIIGSVLTCMVLVVFIIFTYFNKQNNNYCDENCMRNMNATSLANLSNMKAYERIP